MTSAQERLDRQFDRISREVPASAGFLRWVRKPGMALIVGGVFSFLPVLGLWMLPLGLAVLAIDLPFLKGPVGGSIVRFRRWVEVTRRRFRRG